MKIKIKSPERSFTIYIPNFLLTSGVRLTKLMNKSFDDNNVSKDKKEKVNNYLNHIDMDFILLAIKELKKYKGLELVNVKSNDGTEVLIRV